MAWKKAPQELVDFLSEVLDDVECQKRTMFGYPAYFINGNMFVAAHQDNLILRFSMEVKEGIKQQYEEVCDFEPMPGRVMREYLVIPGNIYGNEEAFASLLNISIEYASSLPPKAKKKKRRDNVM